MGRLILRPAFNCVTGQYGARQPKDTSMKHAFLLLAITMVAAFPAGAQTRRQIVAGPVKATGDTISGSFRVDAPRRRGIQSSGTGGACLVAEPGDRECSTDVDCSDLRTKYHPAGAAYCLRQGGMKKHKTCWVRPGPDLDFCLKSPVAPLPAITRIDLPQVDPRVMGAGPDVRWRVHACLNGYDAAAKADNHACGDSTASNRMTSDGPPRRIP
jgi:hypothetical protein